jgi:hypothetical protein
MRACSLRAASSSSRPFATPWTARLLSDALSVAHRALDFSGPGPAVEGVGLLFANLMGSIVVVWSVVRLRTPTLELGRADTVGRVLFSTWMAWALAHSATPLLVPFLVLEVGWALLQGAVVLGGRWHRLEPA